MVRRVADVNESDLVILAVVAPRDILFAVLKPVRANDVWVLKCPSEVVHVSIGALLLIRHTSKTWMDHAAVQCAKVELADDQRYVDSVQHTDVRGRETITVDAHHVAVFCGGRNQQLVLAALERLASDRNNPTEDIVLLSGGTDGEDGPTDAAGAFFDSDVIAAMRATQLEPGVT